MKAPSIGLPVFLITAQGRERPAWLLGWDAATGHADLVALHHPIEDGFASSRFHERVPYAENSKPGDETASTAWKFRPEGEPPAVPVYDLQAQRAEAVKNLAPTKLTESASDAELTDAYAKGLNTPPTTPSASTSSASSPTTSAVESPTVRDTPTARGTKSKQ